MSQGLISKEAEVSLSTETIEARTLSRTLDRCDRCGAQAYHLAQKGATELLFCNHHGVAFKAKLIEQGFGISDQSKSLFEQTKPDSSAAA